MQKEWHLVEKTRQVGGLVKVIKKSHKRGKGDVPLPGIGPGAHG